MNMTDIFYGTGRFFQWTFKFISGAQNVPNIIFWIIICALIVVWLRMQARFNNEAKTNGTIK
jgi:hypothetical protein